MNPEREVLENTAIAIVGDRIAAIGPSAELEATYQAAQVIDASKNVVMPGLIDGHGHAGHGLVKSLGTDTGEWYQATEIIYATGSTEDFWRADALLTATERLRFGVTTGLTYLRRRRHRHEDRRSSVWGRLPASNRRCRRALVPGRRTPPASLPPDLCPLGGRHPHRCPGDLREAARGHGRSHHPLARRGRRAHQHRRHVPHSSSGGRRTERGRFPGAGPADTGPPGISPGSTASSSPRTGTPEAP